MLKRFLMRSVVLSLVGLSSSAYGMLKKPQDFGECKKPTSQTSLALQNVSQRDGTQDQRSLSDTRRSLNDLPQLILFSIMNYLSEPDQRNLGMTNHQMLYLWGARTRALEWVPVSITTPHVTRFHWNSEWPQEIHPTVIIDVSDSINQEAILRLNNLLRRETVRHLHFEGTGDLGLDIDPILCDRVRFPVLESLVFNGVGPVYYTQLNKGVRKLRNFIVRNTRLQGTPTVLLMFSRPSLSYILFQGADSEDLRATMQGTEGLTAHHHNMATLDIRAPASHPNDPNTRLAYFNGETIQATEFRENLPLQRARMTYRMQGVTLVVNGQRRLIPWHALFPHLYPDFVSMRGLMQMITLRSQEDRMQVLERHLHGAAGAVILEQL